MQRKHNANMVPFAKELRANMTKEEKHLWYDFLRGYPVRFSRQKVLGRYIADFYCAEAKVVIEVDGAEHDSREGRKHDEERTALLQQYGLQVIRIPNTAVRDNFQQTRIYIDQLVKQAVSEQSDKRRLSDQER